MLPMSLDRETALGSTAASHALLNPPSRPDPGSAASLFPPPPRCSEVVPDGPAPRRAGCRPLPPGTGTVPLSLRSPLPCAPALGPHFRHPALSPAPRRCGHSALTVSTFSPASAMAQPGSCHVRERKPAGRRHSGKCSFGGKRFLPPPLFSFLSPAEVWWRCRTKRRAHPSQVSSPPSLAARRFFKLKSIDSLRETA